MFMYVYCISIEIFLCVIFVFKGRLMGGSMMYQGFCCKGVSVVFLESLKRVSRVFKPHFPRNML